MTWGWIFFDMDENDRLEKYATNYASASDVYYLCRVVIVSNLAPMDFIPQISSNWIRFQIYICLGCLQSFPVSWWTQAGAIDPIQHGLAFMQQPGVKVKEEISEVPWQQRVGGRSCTNAEHIADILEIQRIKFPGLRTHVFSWWNSTDWDITYMVGLGLCRCAGGVGFLSCFDIIHCNTLPPWISSLVPLIWNMLLRGFVFFCFESFAQIRMAKPRSPGRPRRASENRLQERISVRALRRRTKLGDWMLLGATVLNYVCTLEPSWVRIPETRYCEERQTARMEAGTSCYGNC